MNALNNRMSIIRLVIFSSLKDKYFTMADVFYILERIKERYEIEVSKEFIIDYIENLCENGIVSLVPTENDTYALMIVKNLPWYCKEEFDLTRK